MKRKNNVFTVQQRRKRESKTDYDRRLKLLKSGKHRLVIRKSLKNMIIQVVQYTPSGDVIAASAAATELKKFGWKSNIGNLPASYLTGLLAAKRAVKAGVKEAILDLGLDSVVKGSRIFAALKGALEGGLAVPHSEDVLPSEERAMGAHAKDAQDIQKMAEQVKKNIIGAKDEKED